jgi:uncharacterized membrane protein
MVAVEIDKRLPGFIPAILAIIFGNIMLLVFWDIFYNGRKWRCSDCTCFTNI